jgi:hypothetical protein
LSAVYSSYGFFLVSYTENSKKLVNMDNSFFAEKEYFFNCNAYLSAFNNFTDEGLASTKKTGLPAKQIA